MYAVGCGVCADGAMVWATTESGWLNAADDACTAACRRLSASILVIRMSSTLSRKAWLATSARRCGDTHGLFGSAADDDDGPAAAAAAAGGGGPPPADDDDGPAAAAAAAGGGGPPPAEDDDDDDDDDGACLDRDDADDAADWWCAGNPGPIPDDGGATDIGSDLDDA